MMNGSAESGAEPWISEDTVRQGQAGIEAQRAVHANRVRCDAAKLLNTVSHRFQRVPRETAKIVYRQTDIVLERQAPDLAEMFQSARPGSGLD